MLISIVRKCDGSWSGFIWLRVGTGGGHLQTRECTSVFSSTKFEEFLDQLRTG